MRDKLVRWAAPLAAGLVFFLVLVLALCFRFKGAEAGNVMLFAQGLMTRSVERFAIGFVLTLLLPFYLLVALVLWCLALAWASAFVRDLARTWTASEGFLITLAGLTWIHLCLWWSVPSTLWLLPALRWLPFWLLLPMILAAALVFPIRWVRQRDLGGLRGAAALVGWLVLWSLLPWAPQHLPRLLCPAKGGTGHAKVLIIGLDALRPDVGEPATTDWVGTTFSNAYTVIPSTRLLWHILWGGDPLFYTVGQTIPAREELVGTTKLPLVDTAARLGWKPRFYIDDGGTVGLSGNSLNFDDVLMPAPGWENFVNSNLSGSFPIFAAWENWGRAFPTTNPWAPLDAGLREALRLGRGSQWVMFHSCLAHQPIFLNRAELASLPHWWTLAPRELEPYYVKSQVTPDRAADYDPRRNPFRIYTIRMQAVLDAWRPIWNGLAQDPDYRDATRVLFSDHGERFYHVTDNIQLSGVHGYNLDPYEARIMLKVAGPGFAAGAGAPPRPGTISVLSLRDAIAQQMVKGTPILPGTLEQAYPEAPLRCHTLDQSMFTQELAEYRHLPLFSLVDRTTVAPDGIWFTTYAKPASERAEEVSIGWGRGSRLDVIKPLVAGGAHLYHFDGLALKSIDTISEAAYAAEKERSKKALMAHPLASTLGQ
jgi:hypothetical protein